MGIEDSSLEELACGWKEEEGDFVCVYCGNRFEKGRIYQTEDSWYDAWGMVRYHVEDIHQDAAAYLLSMPSDSIGTTALQKRILQLMYEGRTDKEIAGEIGITPSTVRNHRFKLREKEKQAKHYLALMYALQEKTKRPITQADGGQMEEAPAFARMVDERYAVTDAERDKILRTYMDANGAILQFPAREKKKIIILKEIMKHFVEGEEYSEKEVNRILERMYEDYPTIRRALIEYGFLERSKDCSVYRVRT